MEKRIGELAQPGSQEPPDGVRLAQAPIEEALDEEGRDFELRRQLAGEQGLRWSQRPAVFHGPSSGRSNSQSRTSPSSKTRAMRTR